MWFVFGVYPSRFLLSTTASDVLDNGEGIEKTDTHRRWRSTVTATSRSLCGVGLSTVAVSTVASISCIVWVLMGCNRAGPRRETAYPHAREPDVYRPAGRRIGTGLEAGDGA